MTILAAGIVFDGEEPVLDAPMAAAEGEQPSWLACSGGRLVTR
jgi:hypothetical protein